MIIGTVHGLLVAVPIFTQLTMGELDVIIIQIKFEANGILGYGIEPV